MRLASRVRSRWQRLPGNVRGGLWVLIAAFFFSIMTVLIKMAGQTLHVTVILFLRQMTMLLMAAPVILRNFPGSLISARPDLQAIRIFCAFLAMLLGFTSIIHLPLADATTLNFAKTFFVSILAIIFLGEVVGIRRWGAITAGFIGVVIVAWPTGEGVINIYSLMAIGGAFAVAVIMILLRKITQVDKPVTILSYQAIGVGALMLPPAIYFWQTPTLWDVALIIAIGAVSSLGQLANIQGFKHAEASVIAPLDYGRLVYAIILGIIIFGEWPAARVYIGAAIIVAAALYTLHRERVKGQVKAATEAKKSVPGD